MPNLELLNEFVVLRAWQLPSVPSRIAGPLAWIQKPNPKQSEPFSLHPHVTENSVPSRSQHLDMVIKRDKAGTRALRLLCWRVALTPAPQQDK